MSPNAKVRARKSHIFAKGPRGWYVEPSWTSKRLFEEEQFRGGIYDPSCGWGHITTEARRLGYRVWGSDIVDRGRHGLGNRFFLQDFLTEARDVGYARGVSIVCNPPFDYVQEFCERALEVGAQKVAMICLLRRLNAAHWLQALPLRRVHLLTPRPSMPTGQHCLRVERRAIDKTTGRPCKIGGGKQDFVWLVFERGYKGRPEIAWLHRDR